MNMTILKIFSIIDDNGLPGATHSPLGDRVDADPESRE
jgi:hypothetical protein